MIKTLWCLILFFFFFYNIDSQDIKAEHKTVGRIGISFLNANTSFPGSGNLLLTSTTLHPGLDVYFSNSIKSYKKHQFYWSAHTGLFYHRLSQWAVRAFGSIGYQQFFLNHRISISTDLYAGYLHSIPDLQVFKLNSNQNYERSGKWGRPQALAAFGLKPSYHLKLRTQQDIQIFFEYQFMIQTPFVKNYVPVLPYSIFQIGIGIPISIL